MKDFVAPNRCLFNRSHEPTDVETWITNIQQLMEALDCTDEQKVKYTRLKLPERPWGGGNQVNYFWSWNMEVKMQLLGSFFKDFYKHFFPTSQRQMMAIEFLNLVKGNMTME